MSGFFDSHAHYLDRRFQEDRDEVLTRLPSQGIAYIMEAACHMKSSRQAVELAKRYDYLYCAVGIHPHDAQTVPQDLEQQLEDLASQPKVQALGEMGLDYHYDFSPRDKQKEVFERQLALAVQLDLPVIVHDREAHQDTLELLKKYRPKGVVHCYSGSAEMAEELVKMGLYIGFTGVVTFRNAKKPLEAAASVPLDKLLLETDCPYMAPEPFRGKRCDSSMLAQTAHALAKVKNVEPEELAKITCENACRLFEIPCVHKTF